MADSTRFPLSRTQEWFLAMDRGDDDGPFGSRYLIVSALRITGAVDVPVLQGALDDVVARHELLRTVVVRDSDPPYQLVCPPPEVPLEVRDMPPADGVSRDAVIQELIAQAHAGSISARRVPLIRALLARFDDQDSVLFVTVHHSVCDGWSVQVILRDLAAFYQARATGQAPKLPPARQYREYAAWQRAEGAGPARDRALEFWRETLDGAAEFAVPNDHGRPDKHSRPYSLQVFGIGADVMAAAAALGTAVRGTRFMVMLSAIYVLAYQISGSTDLTVRAVTAGRDEPRFHDTMGMFLNNVPFRTQIGGCASFRDILTRTRDTFIDAMANEIPATVIEGANPGLIETREDPRMSQFLMMQPPSQFGQMTFPIAGGATEIDEVLLDEEQTSGILAGIEWHLNAQPDGTLSGAVHYNLDEFSKGTVQGWTATFTRILANAVRDPGQDWRQL